MPAQELFQVAYSMLSENVESLEDFEASLLPAVDDPNELSLAEKQAKIAQLGGVLRSSR